MNSVISEKPDKPNPTSICFAWCFKIFPIHLLLVPFLHVICHSSNLNILLVSSLLITSLHSMIHQVSSSSFLNNSRLFRLCISTSTGTNKTQVTIIFFLTILYQPLKKFPPFYSSFQSIFFNHLFSKWVSLKVCLATSPVL